MRNRRPCAVAGVIAVLVLVAFSSPPTNAGEPVSSKQCNYERPFEPPTWWCR